MINQHPSEGREFASTASMAGLIDYNAAWLKKNIGELFIEDVHTIRMGYKSRRWDVPLVLNRISNLNNEKAHREFMERRKEYLNNPSRA